MSLLLALTSAAAPSAPQRLEFWKPLALAALGVFASEDDARAVNHQALHAFRAPAAATAGQPHFLLYRKASQPSEAEANDVKSASQALHLYRQAFQTVGQPFATWPRAKFRIDADEFDPRKPADLTPFRSATAATAATPWWMLQRKPTQIEPEEDARRSDQSLLHRYRTGYQTVGQPWQTWPAPAKADQTVEPDAVRGNHGLLHRYRTGYQTVGQPWLAWPIQRARIEDEAFAPAAVPNLHAYRQYAATATGQPWWMWTAARGEQTTEPHPAVTDHAAALYPFRPHNAIAPPVEEAQSVFGGVWQLNRLRAIEQERERELERERLEKEASQAREVAEQRHTALAPKKRERRAPSPDRHLSPIERLTGFVEVQPDKLVRAEPVQAEQGPPSSLGAITQAAAEMIRLQIAVGVMEQAQQAQQVAQASEDADAGEVMALFFMLDD